MPKKYSSEQAAKDASTQIRKHNGKPTKTPKCRCTNHMGTPKQQFKTRENALSVIVRHHMWTRKGYRVYPCPTSDRFHIASNK